MDRDLYSGVGLCPILGPGGLYPILQHPILGAAGRSTHNPLSWACGREHRQASGGERESSWSPGGTSGAPRVSPAPSQESAGPLLGRRRVRESVTESSWPPRGTSRSAQGVACTVTVLRLRAWTSVPCTVLGPCVQYKSMSDFGLSGVQPTVNSQSTHSQLDSQLTVNSQSTRQSTQRTPGPPNPGILLGLVEKGVVICLDKEEGWEDRPLLIILIKLKRVFWWSWWPLFSSIRDRTPGFCGPVDR